MSTTDLCNEALQAIGTRSAIADINENSKEAKNCLIAFDRVRKKLISAAPWGFCKMAEQLSLLKALPGTPELPGTWPSQWLPTFPPPGWMYSYAMPSACLRLRYVTPNQAGFYNATYPYPFRFSRGMDKNAEGQQVAIVATNARNAIGIFNTDVTDDDLWDADFREAFINALGAALAMALAGDKNLATTLIQITNAKIIEAEVRDANEANITYNTVGTNIAAREQFFNPAFAEPFAVP